MDKEHVITDRSSAGGRVESAALTVAFKDYSKWFVPVAWLLLVGVRWVPALSRGVGLTPVSMSLTPLNTVWFVGFILIEVNLVLAALRTGRGLTLDVEGITWHGSELFLPWSNVDSVQVGPDLKRQGARADADVRLVVKAVEPSYALDGQRGMARIGIQANVQRF